jgi:hypothetical protein
MNFNRGDAGFIGCILTVIAIIAMTAMQDDLGVAFSPNADLKIWIGILIFGFTSLVLLIGRRPSLISSANSEDS